MSGFLGDKAIQHEIQRDDTGWRWTALGSRASGAWSISTLASRRRRTCCSFRASR